MRYPSATVGVISLLLLIGYIYFDRGDLVDGQLWSNEFAEIEYVPGNGNSFRFIKEGGMLKQRLYVKTENGPERRAASSVQNIFQDWEQLKVHGEYHIDDVPGIVFSDEPFLKLYRRPSEDPIHVYMSDHAAGGNTFIRMDARGTTNSVFLIRDFQISRLENSAMNFRSRRFVFYPAESYTHKIDIFYAEQRDSVLSVNQRKEPHPEQEGQEVSAWFSKREEIATSLGAALENSIRQIEIKYFADEVGELPDPESIWESSGEEISARIAIRGGDTVTISMKKPAEPIEYEGSNLVLVQSSLDDFTDYAEEIHWISLRENTESILASVAE